MRGAAGRGPGRGGLTGARPAGRRRRRTKRRGGTAPRAPPHKAVGLPPPGGGQRRRLHRPPRPIRGEGTPGRTPAGGVGVVATIALPPLRPAARRAPASGDLAVSAQPGSGSARTMGSAAALRHRRRVFLFPACRPGLSARPRCPPSPRQSRLPFGRWRGAAAPEGRKRLGRGARAATPPRRDPGARGRPATERAAPGGAPGGAPGDRASPGRDA